MKLTKLIMGMPITIEVLDENVKARDLEEIFKFFRQVDMRFSTYKVESEISQINSGKLEWGNCSREMKKIFKLAEQTKRETNGYFDINRNGHIDPSGIVKGWAIWEAAHRLNKMGFKNYYVDAGGDVQTAGKNREGKAWAIGIRNPFNREENVKVIAADNIGVATSGTAIRGQHIYNPHNLGAAITDIVSLTVIGPNIFEADRFATAAFAMGKTGIYFIDSLAGCEGYMIDAQGNATQTTNFEKYVL